MRDNQKGFTAVEAVLILVITGILSFVGWYVYHSKNNASSTYNSAANTSANTKTTTTRTTSEQPNQTKFDEFFSSYRLAKLAIGKTISPPTSVPTDTTAFNSATDQLCSNVTIKKAISAGSLSTAIYNVSTKQNAIPQVSYPQALPVGGSSGCGKLEVTAGQYEYKVYIDNVLVVDLAFTVK